MDATLLTQKELAKALGVSARHINRVIQADENFPAYRIGTRDKYDLREVKEHLAHGGKRRKL
jgi:excisionase family DNA binding protein